MAGTFEYRLWQLRILLWVLVWTSLCVFISMWTMAGGFALLGTGVALYYFLHSTKRGPFAHRPRPPSEQPPDTPEQREREARYMVTQMLRSLTRAQVTYLCQDFASDKEATAWLKNALPRGYRHSIEELHRQLQQAKAGKFIPEGTKLALRVLEHRDEMLATIAALERAHGDHPDHVIANPVIFVITEHLSTSGDDEPQVVTLAGWNPDKPALLPDVDLLNLFSEEGSERQIRGQAQLSAVKEALGKDLKVEGDEPAVYVVPAQDEDLARRGVTIGKVPLGFVIGTAELV